MELTIEKVYSEHYNKVSSWTKKVINNREDAEELTSDIFMKLHNNITSYDPNKSALSTWVMRITRNAIIDYWRTIKNLTTSISDIVDDEGNEMIPNIYTDNVTPETEMISDELGENIMNAIISLPSSYQRIADLFLIEEKSYDEICATLDIPLGTVKGTISRAKELLRKRLTNL